MTWLESDIGEPLPSHLHHRSKLYLTLGEGHSAPKVLMADRVAVSESSIVPTALACGFPLLFGSAIVHRAFCSFEIREITQRLERSPGRRKTRTTGKNLPADLRSSTLSSLSDVNNIPFQLWSRQKFSGQSVEALAVTFRV